MEKANVADLKAMAKKYKISVMNKVDGKYKPKGVKLLSKEIYDYETLNGVVNGLFYRPAEEYEDDN